MKVLSTVSSILLSASLASAAQAHFCIGGNLDQLTEAQIVACEHTSAALEMESQRAAVSAGWHFITVCDEAGWQTVVALQGDGALHALRANQATDGKLHLTFVHGTQVRAADTQALDAVLLQAGAAEARRAPAGTGMRVAAGQPVLTPTSLPLPTSRH